jgi:DNA-binding XRE family transcriptional regulator
MDYSQKQLALLLGYARTSQISKWEHGKKLPTLKNALSLACILQVPVEALFAGLAAEIADKHTRRAQKLSGPADKKV